MKNIAPNNIEEMSGNSICQESPGKHPGNTRETPGKGAFTKGTLFYDRSFLTVFPTSKFEINTEDVYIFLTNHKYQYDQVFLVSFCKKNS